MDNEPENHLAQQMNKFAAFCANYSICQEWRNELFRKLRDREAFMDALKALNPERKVELTTNFVELILAQSSGYSFGPEKTVRGISKKDFLKASKSIQATTEVLQAQILVLLDLAQRAADYVAISSKREAFTSAIETLRKELVDLNEGKSAAGACAWIFQKELEERKLKTKLPLLGTSLRSFDRQIASLWNASGKRVTTTSYGPFAMFLTNVHKCCRNDLLSLSDNLQAAKVEQDETAETTATHAATIGEEMARAQTVQRRITYDHWFSGRAKGSTNKILEGKVAKKSKRKQLARKKPASEE